MIDPTLHETRVIFAKDSDTILQVVKDERKQRIVILPHSKATLIGRRNRVFLDSGMITLATFILGIYLHWNINVVIFSVLAVCFASIAFFTKFNNLIWNNDIKEEQSHLPPLYSRLKETTMGINIWESSDEEIMELYKLSMMIEE